MKTGANVFSRCWYISLRTKQLYVRILSFV